MRMLTRTLLGTAAAIPLALATPGLAAAAEPTDVTYSFAVDGTSVTNTITSAADGTLSCATSLAPAPDGVLPPLEDILGPGQTLYDGGDIEPGTSTQTVSDVPPGSYVVLATCALRDGDATEAMWVSDYPGFAEYMATVLPWTVYTVQQASTVFTVPEAAPEQAFPSLDDLADAFGS
nr:hypothetical protein [Rhodococcus sp. UNC23MFCrub1.1]